MFELTTSYTQKEEKPVTDCINEKTVRFSRAEKLTSTDSIKTLHKHAVSNLLHLQELTLIGNGIETIEVDALVNLPKLKSLVLTLNKLSSIKSKNFKGLPVQSLHLQHNQISTIEADAFDGMDNLTDLVLHHNTIAVWYGKYFGSTNTLNRLDLSSNHINTIASKSFTKQTQLSILNLSNNRLAKVYKYMFDGQFKLSLLDISNNVIDYIAPDAEIGIGHLKSINLGNNKIIRIPLAFLKHLQHANVTFVNNPILCPCLFSLEKDFGIKIVSDCVKNKVCFSPGQGGDCNDVFSVANENYYDNFICNNDGNVEFDSTESSRIFNNN